MLHAVIMAGGAGTRFWPASRADRPKQLLDLAGEESMIQATVRRLKGLVPAERILVVTNRRLVEPIRRQLPDLAPDAIVGEPCKRDTAPCVGLAAALVMRNDPEATMLVLPADHVIQTDQQFQAAVQHAVNLVEQAPERIVTFGIRPSYPAEVFGYIERGEAVSGLAAGSPPTFAVRKFHEKPQAAVAQNYVASGNYYWNAGIFVWRAGVVRQALATFEPAISQRLETIAEAMGGANYARVLDEEFAAIAGKSIDFAVLERYSPVIVVEAPFAWDDVGSWESLARLRGVDAEGNTIAGKHVGVATQRTIVRGEGEHLIVTVGLDNCIVVHTPDATLIANRSHEESIREVVKQLEQRGWKEYL